MSTDPDTMAQVLYEPGQEPEDIRQKIQRLKEKLDSAYPDKVIFRLHNDHKCTGAVSGKTDYLVLGALGGVGEKKVWTARQLQAKGSSIQVISEETLYQFL